MNNIQPPKFSRSMNLFDIVCLGINGIVGAGIFLLPGQIAAQVGSFSIFVFIFCGFLCFAIALCFAEMGGIYQKTGGTYLYARDTFGPLIGFMVGWMVWLSTVIGWAAMARGFLLYLGYFIPSLTENGFGELIVVILIIMLSTLNFFGVKIGASTINFFTVSKLVPLFVFITFGFQHIEVPSLSHVFNFDIRNIGEAMVIALFAYTGFEHMPVPAGEMKKPKRDIPVAFFLVIMGTTLIYTLIQIVAVGTFSGLAQSERPLSDAAHGFLGQKGVILISIGALLAIAGVNAGIALTGPRNLYALSADGFLAKSFSKIHPKTHTPYVAIATNTILTLILFLTGTFQYLILASVIVSLFQYIPTCLAVIVLRKKRANISSNFIIPGGYVIPLLALGTCFWLLSQMELVVILATLAGMLISLPFYFFRKEKISIK